MSMGDQWQLDNRHSGALIRLQKLLEHTKGFHAFILQHNNPRYRDGLIRLISTAHDSDPEIINLPDYTDFSAFETRLQQATKNHELIHLINLENYSTAQRKQFFRGINYHREYLARISQKLLFWIPEFLVRDMALQAADFWAWREQVLDFSLPVEIQPRWEASFKNTTGLKLERKQKRIEEIQTYLAEHNNKPINLTQADLYYELGNLYESIGEYQQAKTSLSTALAHYRELDERHAYARALSDLAYLKYEQGFPQEALDELQNKVLPWFIKLQDLQQQGETQGRIADILQARGQLDEALAIREQEQLPVYEQLGDVREKAVTMGKIADILQDRGQLDQALSIREQEELPVYEQLGDVREKAVTRVKIAGILQARGQLDQALATLEETLPVFEQLGDVRSKAVTLGKIADILQARGQLDQALSTLEETLPVYEQLGDVREKAVTRGKIADILQARGQLDQALAIREQEELPVYEQLGDVRSKAVTLGKIADILQARGQLDQALAIRENEQLPVYEQLGDVRSKAVTLGKIADILQDRGQLDQALAIRENEQLPVFEQLGAVRDLLVGRVRLALLLWQMDAAENAAQVQNLLCLALADAQKLQLPEAGQIENILAQRGLSCEGDVEINPALFRTLADGETLAPIEIDSNSPPEDLRAIPINYFSGNKHITLWTSITLPTHEYPVDETAFLQLLLASISLSPEEKKRIIDSFSQLDQEQIDGLIDILQQEVKKFSEFPESQYTELDAVQDRKLLEWVTWEVGELKAITDA